MYVVIVKVQMKPEYRKPFLAAMLDNARSSEEKAQRKGSGLAITQLGMYNIGYGKTSAPRIP